MDELITVGISCYNIEAYVARCIESVRAQTHTNLEILIVDDGSTDKTGEICDGFSGTDKRIRVIHKENAGLGSTRNRVIEEARGSYIAFVDGDDYVEPAMYATLLAACREHDAPLAVCRFFEEKEGCPVTKEAGTRKETVLDRDRALTLFVEEDDAIPIRNAAWNKLYRKDVIERFRYPENRLYEDIVVTTKVIAACEKVAFVDTPLYHYIIDRGGSIMNRGVNPRILTDQIPAYREKGAFLRDAGREDLADTHAYLVYKKLLRLYTQTFGQKDGRALRKGLKKEIDRCRTERDRVFGCRIADKHQILRMRLFLIHPALYNLFTVINDSFVHRIRGIT